MKWLAYTYTSHNPSPPYFVCLSSVASFCPPFPIPFFFFLKIDCCWGPDGYTSRRNHFISFLCFASHLDPQSQSPSRATDYLLPGFYHGITRQCRVIVVATDAVGPEESVSERAGAVHIRVTKPRWYLPILVRGHDFVLLVFWSGRL